MSDKITIINETICSTSLPGGNQVDGLPPASSLPSRQPKKLYFENTFAINVRPAVNRQPGFRREDS